VDFKKKRDRVVWAMTTDVSRSNFTLDFKKWVVFFGPGPITSTLLNPRHLVNHYAILPCVQGSYGASNLSVFNTGFWNQASVFEHAYADINEW